MFILSRLLYQPHNLEGLILVPSPYPHLSCLLPSPVESSSVCLLSPSTSFQQVLWSKPALVLPWITAAPLSSQQFPVSTSPCSQSTLFFFFFDSF